MSLPKQGSILKVSKKRQVVGIFAVQDIADARKVCGFKTEVGQISGRKNPPNAT